MKKLLFLLCSFSLLAGEFKLEGLEVLKDNSYFNTEFINKVYVANDYFIFEKKGKQKKVKKEDLLIRYGRKNRFISKLTFVKGGSFMMGSSKGEGFDEKPEHKVNIADFYIGSYEVTQKEYKSLMGENPSSFEGKMLPVEYISWYDAIDYCNKLSKKQGIAPAYDDDGNFLDKNGTKVKDIRKVKGYRLPTEAEWEYAASGGKKSKGYKYSGGNNIKDFAWYDENSGDKTQEVARKKSNELGIYDMTGNVWEWCQDTYSTEAYSEHEDHKAFTDGEKRVRRGSGAGNDISYCRLKNRLSEGENKRYEYLGFRIAKTK